MATANEARSLTAETTDGPASARVARVTGPVVDIEFPHDAIPEIYNALQTDIVIAGNEHHDHARGRAAPR